VWVDMKQELPPDGDCLVVVHRERKVAWSNGEGWFEIWSYRDRSCGRAADIGVTHWMPLPDLPA
jgi:Protein of unknown function (DUF551)